MYSQNILVENRSGVHARPAVLFVQTAAKFQSNITIKKNDIIVSAKSIINILALGIVRGEEITISAEGKDEEIAVNELIKLIKARFGES